MYLQKVSVRTLIVFEIILILCALVNSAENILNFLKDGHEYYLKLIETAQADPTILTLGFYPKRPKEIFQIRMNNHDKNRLGITDRTRIDKVAINGLFEVWFN